MAISTRVVVITPVRPDMYPIEAISLTLSSQSYKTAYGGSLAHSLRLPQSRRDIESIKCEYNSKD